MATTTRELRVKARKLGLANPREFEDSELRDYIKKHSNGANGSKSKVKAAKAVKKAAPERKAKRGPGRPKGLTSKTKSAPAVKSAKRGSTVKRGPGRPPKASSETKNSKSTRSQSKRYSGVGRPPGTGTGTRTPVPDRINFNQEFEYREGTRFAYLLSEIRKSAKKNKDTADIREDVFERLAPKLNKVEELTFINRATGKPFKGDQAEFKLKYYISRTILDYAINTDQHEGSEAGKRQSNGATTTKKRGRPAGSTKTTKRGPGRPRKVDVEDDDEEETPRKRRGRPPGRKNKVKEEVTGKRRGRPPGTKNKVTAKATSTGKKRGRPKGSKNKR